MNRITHIDTARGIGMTLVVLGHSIGVYENPLNRWILSFHMPLFFILSGFFYDHVATSTTADFLRKQIKRLWLPQITLGIGALLMGLIYALYSGDYSKYKNPYDVILQALFGYWFLPVLFYVNIIGFILKKISNNIIRYVSYALLLVFLLALQISNYIPKGTDGLCFSILPMAFIAYLTGAFFKPIFNKELKFDYLLLLILSLSIILSQLNDPVLMFWAKYNNIILFLFSAILGSYFVVQVSFLVNSPLIEWIGKNSVIIYVVHFWFKDHINTIDLHVLSAIGCSSNNTLLYVLNFTALFSITIGISYLINKNSKLKILFRG